MKKNPFENVFVFLFGLSLVLGCWSCVEHINLDEIAETVLVTEAIVEHQANPWVRISQTVSKTGTNDFPWVENALVIVRNEEGVEELLEYMGDGIYQTSALKGELGETYFLEIRANGKLITGESTLTRKAIMLDSIQQYQIIDETREDTVSAFQLFFQDPYGDPTFGVIKVHNFDLAQKQYFFYKNESGEGGPQQLEIRLQDTLATNTQVAITFQVVDEPIYYYFRALGSRQDISSVGGLTVAPPANTYGNLNGETLGYFSAHHADSLNIVID